MRRRSILFGLIGSALNGTLACAGPLRRVGVLMTNSPNSFEAQGQVTAFINAMRQQGWRDGDNLQVIWTWADGGENQVQEHARDLASKQVDVILALGSLSVSAATKASKSIPIIFVLANEPVEQGYTTSLSKPDGNVTGFMAYEYDIGGKWLELLTEIRPTLTDVFSVFGPSDLPSYRRISDVIAAAATARRINFSARVVGRETDIDLLLREYRGKAAGMIVYPSAVTAARREEIVISARESGIPAVFGYPVSAQSGGLAAYGIDSVTIFASAADYVSRVLNGEVISSMPIQSPRGYKLVLNRRVASTWGVQFPDSLLMRADEVIE